MAPSVEGKDGGRASPSVLLDANGLRRVDRFQRAEIIINYQVIKGLAEHDARPRAGSVRRRMMLILILMMMRHVFLKV